MRAGLRQLRFLSTSLPCTQAGEQVGEERPLIIARKQRDFGFALPCGERPRVPTPARARRLLLRGVTKGSDIMKKSLRRILDRLRAATNGTFGERDARARRAAASRSACSRLARAGPAAAASRVRTAIVSTYPPRACGIGTFAADLRGTLLGVDGVERVDFVAVVNEPSSPQRRGCSSTIGAGRARRLRARRPDARPARRRRRAAAARVRDLRRARRRVRALVRGGAGAAARRDPAHGALGADAAPARGAHRALRARPSS